MMDFKNFIESRLLKEDVKDEIVNMISDETGVMDEEEVMAMNTASLSDEIVDSIISQLAITDPDLIGRIKSGIKVEDVLIMSK